MSEFKGTPGPWVIDANDVGSKWNIDALNGESVALSHQVSNDKGWSKRDANTLLIAAAPELLEVLQEIIDIFHVEYNRETRLSIDIIERKARSAIAKALGESK